MPAEHDRIMLSVGKAILATANAVGDVWALWLARPGRSLLFLLRSLRAELCALRGGGSLALLLYFLQSHKEQLRIEFRRFICAAFAGSSAAGLELVD